MSETLAYLSLGMFMLSYVFILFLLPFVYYKDCNHDG